MHCANKSTMKMSAMANSPSEPVTSKYCNAACDVSFFPKMCLIKGLYVTYEVCMAGNSAALKVSQCSSNGKIKQIHAP